MEQGSTAVPPSLLGPHPESFFGDLGRVICLSALLENRMLSLYQALIRARQDQHTGLALSELITRSKAVVDAAEESDARTRLAGYLHLVELATVRRNDYAHNLWPAQADGQLFGWRFKRKPVGDGSTHDVRLTADQLRADVAAVVDVLMAWPTHFALVSAHGL